VLPRYRLSIAKRSIFNELIDGLPSYFPNVTSFILKTKSG